VREPAGLLEHYRAERRYYPTWCLPTEVERSLASLWQEVLGVDQVGLHDDFFQLGGDSMHAITLVGRARLHGFDPTVEDLFRNPTIAAQAEKHIEAERQHRSGDMPKDADRFALLSAEDRALVDGA
jgi:aryl carrier-like protein